MSYYNLGLQSTRTQVVGTEEPSKFKQVVAIGVLIVAVTAIFSVWKPRTSLPRARLLP